MELLVNKEDDKEDKIILSSDVFCVNFNEKLLHQVVVSYLSNSHLKTKKHKSRSEVSGGGIKPWKQKGTGRARVGSIRSPLWRKGGKVFASDGLSFRYRKINKKMYQLSLKIILSDLIRKNRLFIIDSLEVCNRNTKLFLNKLNKFNISNNSLIIVDKFDNNLYYSSRNIKNICLIDCKKINPVILIKYEKVYFTKESISFIEEALSEK